MQQFFRLFYGHNYQANGNCKFLIYSESAGEGSAGFVLNKKDLFAINAAFSFNEQKRIKV